MNRNTTPESQLTRRDFIRTTSTALAGASVLAMMNPGQAVFAAEDNTLKLALIGCGGRGTAAANQALNTSGPVRLVAMADAFNDRLAGSLKNLKEKHADKVDVPAER